ncbi:MAG: hypothetical protein ABIY48_09635 [Acidimicrobiales bacterium]
MDQPPASGPRPSADSPDYAPTSLPSLGARILAFVAILLGGLFGGLIGYGFADLQCTGSCTRSSGGFGLFGAVLGAVGVGIVAVLALRAMGEWRTIQHRDDER